MAASKNRPLWTDLPASVRAQAETLVGDVVIRAENCEGGFSPGFASRLTTSDGSRVFVKAMDAVTWPLQAPMYRYEAAVAQALPGTIAAPRFLGCSDDSHWVVLAFECVDGAEPARPWKISELDRVLAAVAKLAAAASPSPVSVPRDHPRLGGWADLAASDGSRARLATCSSWAAARLDQLIRLEHVGLQAARGDSLVHFDLLPHNVLLAGRDVMFVDWPHARLGAPVIDLLTVLASAAADGIDPEPILQARKLPAGSEPETIDAVLAALAGFWLAGGLEPMPPGLEPIGAAKLRLGRGTLSWLRHRLER